jgi:hypothetical protein
MVKPIPKSQTTPMRSTTLSAPSAEPQTKSESLTTQTQNPGDAAFDRGAGSNPRGALDQLGSDALALGAGKAAGGPATGLAAELNAQMLRGATAGSAVHKASASLGSPKTRAAAADTALKKGSMSDFHAAWKSMSKKEHLGYLGSKKPDRLADAQKLLRAEGKNATAAAKDVAPAVAVETAARAAKSKGDKQVMSTVRDLYVNDRVSMGDARGGWAVTDADDASAETSKTKKSNAKITLDSGLATNPEAAAAFVAHEGLHAHQLRNPPRGNELHSELGAHKIQSRIWDGATKGKGSPLLHNASLEQDMNTVSAEMAMGDDSAKRFLAVRYADGHAKAGNHGRKDDMVGHLLDDADASRILGGATAAQKQTMFKHLTNATDFTNSAEDLRHAKQLWDTMSPGDRKTAQSALKKSWGVGTPAAKQKGWQKQYEALMSHLGVKP